MREFERIRAYLALDVGKAEILHLLGITEAAKQPVAAQEQLETEPPISTVARRAADQAKSMLAVHAAKAQQQQQLSPLVRQTPSEPVAVAQVDTARPAAQQKGGRPADTSDKTAAGLEADRAAGEQAASPQPNVVLRQRVPVPTANRTRDQGLPDRSHRLDLRASPNPLPKAATIAAGVGPSQAAVHHQQGELLITGLFT